MTHRAHTTPVPHGQLTLPTPPQPHLCNCGANKLISVACHERCASRVAHTPCVIVTITNTNDVPTPPLGVFKRAWLNTWT